MGSFVGKWNQNTRVRTAKYVANNSTDGQVAITVCEQEQGTKIIEHILKQGKGQFAAVIEEKRGHHCREELSAVE